MIDGMHAVDSIAIVQSGNMMGHQNVPLEPITITEVVRVGAAAAEEPAAEEAASETATE